MGGYKAYRPFADKRDKVGMDGVPNLIVILIICLIYKLTILVCVTFIFCDTSSWSKLYKNYVIQIWQTAKRKNFIPAKISSLM